MKNRDRIAISVVATAAISTLFLYGTLAPHNPIPEPKWFPQLDKLEHAGASALLTAPLYLALPTWRIATVVGVITFGGLVEVAQGLVGRDAGFDDWFADIAGALIAAVGISLFQRLCSRIRKTRRRRAGDFA